ncbi:MAG: hypothetical protein U5K28_07750 [Halobacteriales archaeon]|nr:hypothetical protein [Halobacteriales archaeon]
MSLELDRDCPECGEEKTFYRAAAMKVHLGTKVKWHCPDCDYGFVRIANGEVAVDTNASA